MNKLIKNTNKDNEILDAVNILMNLVNDTKETNNIFSVNLSKIGESSNSNNLNKYSTKTIYEHGKPSDNKDIINIIRNTFPEFVKKDISLSEMLKVIENDTGYTIQNIIENENTTTSKLHEEFKKNNNIKKTTIAYYGCNENSVKTICKEGLSLLEKQEDTHGYGIYTYTNVFYALLNAKPNKEKNQTIIIVELAEGQTAIGKKGQTNYGDGVMTLTSPNKIVSCFKNNMQAKVKYIMSLRTEANNITNKDDPKLVLHLRSVGVFHSDIWKTIRYNKHIIAAMVAQIAFTEARFKYKKNALENCNGASASINSVSVPQNCNGASADASINSVSVPQNCNGASADASINSVSVPQNNIGTGASASINSVSVPQNCNGASADASINSVSVPQNCNGASTSTNSVSVLQNNIGEFADSILQKTTINNKCVSKLIKIGDKVRIVKPNLEWSFLKDCVGEIMNLYQYGKKSHWQAFILVKNNKIKKQVINKNKNNKLHSKNNISLASIYIYQIEIITSDCEAEIDNKDKNNDTLASTNKRQKINNGSSNKNPIFID